MTYIAVIADNDVDFYLYALAVKEYNTTSPSQFRQIGKYSCTWQNHVDGVLIYTLGMATFLPIPIECVTEMKITQHIENFHKEWTNADEKERAKNVLKFNTRFEAGRKIVMETEKKQTTEHVELIASALKKNPAIIAVAFKEHPQALKSILESILPDILQKILPSMLKTELQDLRKELTTSIHKKLPEIINAMIQ